MRARWIAIAACALVSGCDLLSGLSSLKVVETGSTTSGGSGGETGGSGGAGGTTTTTTPDTCNNGKPDVDLGETDNDCGGPCKACDLGRACIMNHDCASGICRPSPDRICVGVSRIAVGNSHACAVLTNGELLCWGANTHGQLGRGDLTDSAAPVKVEIEDVQDVTVGGPPEDKDIGHTCAITGAGDVFCWGANDSGQLGTGNKSDVTKPLASAVLLGAKGVAAGGEFTCAIRNDATLACWGGDSHGELADGGGSSSPDPVLVSDLVGVTGLAAGARHACAVITGGSVSCWGHNARGEIASAVMVDAAKLNAVPLMDPASLVRAGADFSCAIGAGGLWCWGDNIDGELTGVVPTELTPTPTKLDLANASDAALGADGDANGNDAAGGHACALLPQGKVVCWGNNRKGQLGRGTMSDAEDVPDDVQMLDAAAGIAAGAEVSCARLLSGGVRCWGRNDRGQLGTGFTGNAQLSPVPVAWP